MTPGALFEILSDSETCAVRLNAANIPAAPNSSSDCCRSGQREGGERTTDGASFGRWKSSKRSGLTGAPSFFRRDSMKSLYRLLLLCGLLLVFPGRLLAEDIIVGVSAAFTGTSRGLGIELYRGSMAYLEPFNRRGGIQGKKIAIRAYDDGYDPTPAIRNTIKLIDEDNVFLLMNYVGTPTVTRVLPLLKNYRKKHIYLFFPFTGAEPQRQPPYSDFVFNLRASYRDETEGLVDHFVRLGRKKIAVFYQADAYGRSGWEGVKKALERHALKINGEATYRRGTEFSASLKQQVDILKAAGPDAVVSIGSYAACAALIRDGRDSGWNVPIANVSFVGSEAMADLLLQLGKTRGVDYTGNLINSQVVPSYEDMSLPAVREYRHRMDAYGAKVPQAWSASDYQPLRYSFVSLEGFLNAKLLVQVLTNLGPAPVKDRIKDAVEAIRYMDLGIGSPISFRPDKHQGSNRVYYTTLDEQKFVPLTSWEQWRK
jgi:ABC-type branched-subunit amino acid transport system substrate-binding protein